MIIKWYDTYPLEWCEFMLDKSLSCGTYLQVLAANDAFYDRNSSHIDNGDDHEMEPAEKILGKCKIYTCFQLTSFQGRSPNFLYIKRATYFSSILWYSVHLRRLFRPVGAPPWSSEESKCALVFNVDNNL